MTICLCRLLAFFTIGAIANEKEIYLTPLNGGPKIRVELTSVAQTNYTLRLEGLKGEKLVFRSISCDEQIESVIDTSEVLAFGISPQVIGEKGGFVDLKFTRENGEVSEICLPWGTEILGREMSIIKPLYAGFVLPAKN